MYQNSNQIPTETGNLNITEDQFLHYFERVITDPTMQIPSQHVVPSSNNVQKQIFQKHYSNNPQIQQFGQQRNLSGSIQGKDDFDNDAFNYSFETNNSTNNNMILQQPTPSSSTSSTTSSSATTSNNAVIIDSTTLAAFNRGVTADITEPNLIQCQEENNLFTGEESLNINPDTLRDSHSDISPSVNRTHEQEPN